MLGTFVVGLAIPTVTAFVTGVLPVFIHVIVNVVAEVSIPDVKDPEGADAKLVVCPDFFTVHAVATVEFQRMVVAEPEVTVDASAVMLTVIVETVPAVGVTGFDGITTIPGTTDASLLDGPSIPAFLHDTLKLYLLPF